MNARLRNYCLHRRLSQNLFNLLLCCRLAPFKFLFLSFLINQKMFSLPSFLIYFFFGGVQSVVWKLLSGNSAQQPVLIISLSTDEETFLYHYSKTHMNKRTNKSKKFFVAPEEIKLWITTAKSAADERVSKFKYICDTVFVCRKFHNSFAASLRGVLSVDGFTICASPDKQILY